MSSSMLLKGDLLLPTDASELRLVQVTDTHLTGTPDGELLGMNTARSARAVIDAAKSSGNIDGFLVTGDIAADEQPTAYVQLEEMLGQDTPSLWLPGNHDDIRSHLEPLELHLRRRLRTPNWDVVMLETQVQGEVGGALKASELAALAAAIDQAVAENKYLLVATHHPLRTMGSAWLDEQSVRNADEALNMLAPHADRVMTISGHVHQESDEVISGIRMLTTPSTCVQFAPGSEDFALDDLSPGYRSLRLYADGSVQTEVVRISDENNRPLIGSSGYH
ncbi:putative phosphohydrolase [gamma proteobacterium HIMB55]|nr:putative phosphohydrolase [gamma proteobacterium HIMB55]